jgi:hypothetical protein
LLLSEVFKSCSFLFLKRYTPSPAPSAKLAAIVRLKLEDEGDIEDKFLVHARKPVAQYAN